MENIITSLVTTLESFAKELANMKSAIGDIEAEVQNWVTNIKNEAESANKTLVRVREDIKRLQHMKIVRERELSDLENSVKLPLSVIDEKSNGDTPARNYNWWKERSEIDNGEPIDWEKEHADREEMKLSLMVREGWQWCNNSHEELEAKFRLWTGKAIPWTALKKGKAKNGKIMMNVRFECEQDRLKVYEMRKAIAEEGHLFIGEALSYVERKERWTMLMMCERLKAEGRDVEFENRKICVDGEWWRYSWTDGWKKV